MAYDVVDANGRSDIATYGTNIEAQIHSTCCTIDWVQDEDDRTINIGYDNAGRPTKAWNTALGQSGTSPFIEAGYDSFGNITTVKTYTALGAGARTSTYTYDENDRPTSLTYPDGTIGMEECEYDSVDNIIWSKDGNGLYTLYHYDDLYRLTAVGHTTVRPQAPYDGVNPTPDISISYYGHSDLIQSMTDSTGTSEFKYDERGRLVSYDPANHVPVVYTYNNLDQVKSITSGDYNVQYNYYANGLLKNVTTDGGATTLAAYIYDAAGLAQEIQYGNGTKAQFAYGTGDARYPLSSIAYSNAGGTLLSLGYTSRDNSGNPLSVTDSSLGTINYSAYDGMGRLTGATYPAPIPSQPAGGTYGYDWVDNRLTPPGSSPMVYNSVDQLTSWPGMYNYIYYSDGSLHEVRTSQGVLVASYTYTDDGLLESATYGSTVLSQEWDGMGNRVGLGIQKNGGAEQTWSFLYDPTAGVPAVLEEVGPDGIPVRYFRTPGGSLIARKKGSDWRYYHFDELGSTRLLTDATGSVTDEYVYDSYGSLISHTGTTFDNPYQWVGALGYYTHYQDPDFGLVQMGFRFYDTETGRFTQQDPIGDGINWYAYAGGNPVGAVDPWGLAVGAPGPWESMIPVWGSGRAAVNDFQNGNYLMGTVNAALAVSDAVFIWRSVGTGVIRAGARIAGQNVRSWSWRAVRASPHYS